MDVEETHFASQSKTVVSLITCMSKQHVTPICIVLLCGLAACRTMCACMRLLTRTSMHVVSVRVCVHDRLSAEPNICIRLPVCASEP